MTIKLELLAYVRVSSKDQEKKETHQNQIIRIKRWAEYEGHTIIKWYQDLAKSGKETENHPEFQLMMKEIELIGDGVVIDNLSRFARNPKDLLVNNHRISEDLKKEFFCVKEKIDTTTPHGQFMLTVLAGLYQLELEDFRDRVERGRERKREEKKEDPSIRLGGPVPKEVDRKKAEKELKKGKSVPHVAELLKISPQTLRRRMKNWGIYQAYVDNEFAQI